MNLEPTLAKLLEAWQDGGLSETEEAALLQQLGSDAELRRRFAGQVAMLGPPAPPPIRVRAGWRCLIC